MNPRGNQPAHRLKDNTEPIPNTHDVTPIVQTAVDLARPKRDITHAATGSTSAMDGVVAASTNNKKNNVPMSRPPGISVNTRGNTTNTSEGPCAGFMPYPNTNGKIIIVASSDTAKMDPVMTSEVRTRDLPLSI